MKIETRVGLGVSQFDGPLQQAEVKNAEDETTLTYGSGVVLRVKVIRPGSQPVRSSNGPKTLTEDDESAPPRWEVITGDDGKISIRSKEPVALSSTITVEPVKVKSARWVNVGLCWEDEDHFEKNATRIQAASDKPVVLKVYSSSLYTLKGSIQIGYDPQKPERPTIDGFKGYDRLTFEDGTVFIVKTAKAK